MRFDENRVIELHSVEKDKTVSPPSDRPPKGGSTECNSSAEKALTQPSPKGEGVSAMHSNRALYYQEVFLPFFLCFFIIAHISINIQQKCLISIFYCRYIITDLFLPFVPRIFNPGTRQGTSPLTLITHRNGRKSDHMIGLCYNSMHLQTADLSRARQVLRTLDRSM